MSYKLPHVQAHEAMCKFIGDMAKENEMMKDRINHLENIIIRAHMAFFSHSSDRKASAAMQRILDEEVRKEAKP